MNTKRIFPRNEANGTMKVWGIKLVALATLAGAAACRPTNKNIVRSFLGLESGKDTELRQSDAKIFIQLSDWFLLYSTNTSSTATSSSATGVAHITNVDDIRVGSFPEAYRNLIGSYLGDQQIRMKMLLDALPKPDNDAYNDPEIKRLLDIESRELRDIALAIIYNGTNFVPETGDKLAQAIAMTRPHTAFADRFAIEFLEPLLKTEVSPDFLLALKSSSPNLLKILDPDNSGHVLFTPSLLLMDIERQRQKYLAGLINLYSDDTGRAKLKEQINKDLTTISGLIQYLNTGHVDSNLPDLTGPISVLHSFLVSGYARSATHSATAGAPPTSPNPCPQNGPSDVYVPCNTNDSPAAGPANSLDAAIAADGAANQLPDHEYDVFFADAPPQLNQLVAISTSSPNSSSNSNSNSNYNPNSQQVSAGQRNDNSNNQLAQAIQTFLNPSDSTALRLASGRTVSAPTLPEPSVNCGKWNLSSHALVLCQRHLAYANLKLRQHPHVATALALDNSANSSAGDTTLIKAFIVVGSSDNGGDVSQQGSIGSCSLHGAHSTVRMQLRKLGIDPKKVLLSRGDDINDMFQSVQNSSATMEDAIQAMKTKYGDTMNIDANPVGGWDAVKNILLTQGRPIYVGVNVDGSWTLDGGGAEFANGGGPANGGGKAAGARTCNGGDGHAVAIVGFIGDNAIIKNSWGSEWGNGGLALVDNSCLTSDFTTFYDLVVTKK